MKLLFFIRSLDTSARRFGGDRGDGGRINELLFVRSGKGRLSGEERYTAIGPGDLLFNPEGRLTSAAGHLSLVQILFAEELFSPLVHTEKEALYVLGVVKLYARKQNLITLSRVGVERMNLLLDAMLWEFRNRYRGYSWALRLKLIELLITVMRDRRFKVPTRALKPFTNTRIQDVVLYLHTDYMNHIAVEDVLRTSALGRSRFHTLFKEETGQTFTEYLNGIRCDKAAELLTGTDRTVLDIALTCGFGNLSHFYHVFRRRTGTSPKRYRERAANPT